MTANDRVDFPTIDLCINNAMVWRKKEGSPDCNLSGQPRKRESVRHSRGQLSYRFGKRIQVTIPNQLLNHAPPTGRKTCDEFRPQRKLLTKTSRKS